MKVLDTRIVYSKEFDFALGFWKVCVIADSTGFTADFRKYGISHMEAETNHRQSVSHPENSEHRNLDTLSWLTLLPVSCHAPAGSMSHLHGNTM